MSARRFPRALSVVLAAMVAGVVLVTPASAQLTAPPPSKQKTPPPPAGKKVPPSTVATAVPPPGSAPPPAQRNALPLPNNQKGCLPAPQGTQITVPWPQIQLAPQRVWSLTRGAGVAVAVVDTGVDGQTPQLSGGRVKRGVDVTTPDRGRADDDCYGHGTFVAGIIGASPSPDTGFVGVAPGVTILPIRCATTPADGSAPVLTAAEMADGVRAAVDAGARVINLSASTPVPDQGLEDAVTYAANRDVVVVASAANSAQAGDPVTFPASYPSVIAVGAVDQTGKRADFSQTGSFLSLVAPGVDVVSVGPRGPGHWQGSGTSYSAPFVAGAAALVRSYHPDLTAAQVKHRLEATADHPATKLPDPGFGWGTVNVAAAVTTVLPEEHGSPVAAVVGPPPAGAPPPSAMEGMGPMIALLSVLLVLAFTSALVVVSRISRAGNRRRWDRARVAEIRSGEGRPPDPGS